MPYLTLQEVTVQNEHGESHVHHAGTVLSDWEVSEFVRGKIGEGSGWYRSRFEPLTASEARHHRAKATIAEPPHLVDGQAVPPPWEDYVGLHPTEVIDRMKKSKSVEDVEHVKRYERGGMNRTLIVDYVAPAERPPFVGYDDMHVRDVLEKMSLLGQEDIEHVIHYEMAHRRRPAIIEYERETYEASDTSDDPATTEAAVV